MKNMSFSIFKTILLAMLLLIAVDGKAQSAGSLDTTFGSGGKVVSNLIYDLRDMIVQPDGKIVVAGYHFNSVSGVPIIARYNSNGTLDTSFDTDGYNTSGWYINVASLTLQPDGKLIVGGSYSEDGIGGFSMIRFNPNGSIDTTFGSGGKVITPVGTGSNATSVNIQADGKIVAVGTAVISGSKDFALVRYNSDGSLDTTFGTGGRVATNISNTDESIASSIQPDGKIVAAGYSTDTLSNVKSPTIVRYNTDGTLDTTFGTGGKVIYPTSSNNQVEDMVIQADGKIIIVGYYPGSSEFTSFIARYNPDGTFDINFQFTGNFLAQSAAIQADGKILVGGGASETYSMGTRSVFALIRYNPNGTFDPTFGTNGKVLTSFADYESSVAITALAIQPDGKIVAGSSYNPRFFLVRYRSDSTYKPNSVDFDGDGKADISVFRPSSGTWYTSTNAAANYGAVQFGAADDKLAPADFDGDGKTDVAVYRPSNGTWYILRSAQGFTGINFGAGDDIPVPADFDGDEKADIAVFRPSNGVWYIQGSQSGFSGTAFGASEDKPVAADYDGDGKSDIAVFRPSNGVWYLNRSTQGFTGIAFGVSEDKPVVGDYDGDAKADIVVFRPSNGYWYLQQSTAGFTAVAFGTNGDLPVGADYDGDGKTDVAVYRPGNNFWYLNRSTAGFTGIAFGTTGDKPIPNAYIP